MYSLMQTLTIVGDLYGKPTRKRETTWGFEVQDVLLLYYIQNRLF